MTEKLTQYAKRKAKLTPEQIEYEKAQRRKKDAERRAKRTAEDKEWILYTKKRATARAFIRDHIREEDKAEFKKLLKKL